MFATQNSTRRRVRGAVKVTRKALNRALDAAEPRLERLASDLQEIGVDALGAARKRSLEGVSLLKSNYGKLEKRVKKQLPVVTTRQRAGKLALIAAGVAVLGFGLFR